MTIRCNRYGTHRLAVTAAISTDVKPQQFPHYSAAFRGHPRQIPRQSSNKRQFPRQSSNGNCHGNFHGRQSTAISTENHGIPRPSAAIATAILQYAAIAAELHGNFHGRQSTAVSTQNHAILRPSAVIATATLQHAAIATELHGNFHGNFTDVKPLQFPRHSAAVRGNCIAALRGHRR